MPSKQGLAIRPTQHPYLFANLDGQLVQQTGGLSH